jgi:glyoxylase I family protein
MRVHHIAIQVRDLERARAFYVDVLGLSETRRQAHSIWVDAEGVILMLEHAIDPAGPPPWKSATSGLHLLALTIGPNERAAWRAKLTAAGAPIEGETGFTLYTRDPDGTRIGLSSYPAPHEDPA